MAQTATTLASVLKERWTSDTLQKQFLSDDSLLKRIEAVEATMIGRQAQVPVWGDLNSGGYTTISAAGGAINTSSNQGTNQGVFTLTTHVMPINLEFSALNQASGSNLQSIISGKNLEVEGAMATIRRQAVRQLATNGDGIVAQCATANTTTVNLIASPAGTAWGYDAIVRNWLRPGAVVDIGTAADTDALATATTVTAVSESSTAPNITVSAGTLSTTAGTHFVYIANPNSATAANPELNGLRNIINTTGALGGLNPATAGQEYWQAAARDTTTTVFSLDLMLNLTRATKQKAGSVHSETWMGLKQMANYYSLLQNQVRFAGDSLKAGNWESVQWGGTTTTAFPDILDSDVFCVTPEALCRITGAFTKPMWMTEVYGSNQQLQWHAGFTDGADALVYAFQVGAQRRNGMAAATALTA